MSKKLQHNGLFESSRMMLPEHKEAYLQHQKQVKMKPRPILDGQEKERLSRLLAESMVAGTPISLRLHGEQGERRLTGRVVRFDQQQARLLLCGEGFTDWIALQDIVGAAE